MRTQMIEGSKQQIAQQVVGLEGKVVRALVFVEDGSDAASPGNPDFEQDLDRMMSLGSSNAVPADVSREAMYSPEEA